MGAGNSAVIVDLPRWGPMLSPRVPNLVPIPGPRMERETPGGSVPVRLISHDRGFGHPQGALRRVMVTAEDVTVPERSTEAKPVTRLRFL